MLERRSLLVLDTVFLPRSSFIVNVLADAQCGTDEYRSWQLLNLENSSHLWHYLFLLHTC